MMIPNLNVQEIHDTIPGMRPAMADADLIKTMALHIESLEAQRDMLAQRCAEQARQIAGLLDLQAEDAAEAERHPLADAIAAMQRQGVR